MRKSSNIYKSGAVILEEGEPHHNTIYMLHDGEVGV